MSDAPKLTKKQKKSLAFRDRKTGKGKGKNAVLDGMEDNDLPVMEDQDIDDLQGNEVETQGVGEKKGSAAAKGKAKGKAKEVDQDEAGSVAKKAKKRKRDEDTDTELDKTTDAAEPPKSKKKKGTTDKDGAAVVGSATRKKKGAPNDAKQRFLLFLGNLKYTTSLEAIAAHFAICDPPPTIRLLTPKPSSSSKTTAKSKGCAFLEFAHRNALQQALKLHQSELDGRMINVELTAGGGGKSDSRLTKLKERNKGLYDQRQERMQKDAEDGQSFFTPERPQRYSATSGVDKIQSKKRTWTVGDVEDDGETHRGGQKHSRVRQSRAREWGTGVNAIPVG